MFVCVCVCGRGLTYAGLNHDCSLCSHATHKLFHPNLLPGRHSLMHDVYCNECSSPTHASTAVDHYGTVGRVNTSTNTPHKLEHGDSVLWHTKVRPGGEVELSDLTDISDLGGLAGLCSRMRYGYQTLIKHTHTLFAYELHCVILTTYLAMNNPCCLVCILYCTCSV